ncbi:MAG: nitroreductase/quinone reductase family protein [Actinomycetota bacterium]
MLGMTRDQVLAFNLDVITTFRTHDGVMPEGPFQGNPTLLLTMTGARTGRSLTTPLTYVSDHDRALLVMASAGGSPTLPAWAHNIRANPQVTVEVLGDRYDARAEETVGDERARVLARMTAALPRFGEYQQSVERMIPLFRLVRA